MITYKTLLIDDEPLARQRLKRLLQPFGQFDIVGEASNGEEGRVLVDELQPGLIFLDIEMPVLNGFEMLAVIRHQPKVIFTTAYDQYAIKAFEENSVDYLLKPIERERLEKTVKKLQHTDAGQNLDDLQHLIEQLKPKKEVKTLTVKTGDKILLLKLDDICHIEAEDKYVFLRTADGNNHLTEFTLSVLEAKLPENFIRIHRGSIINTDKIREIRKSFNGALVFVINDKNGSKVTSSRSYGEELRARFDI
ncbi:LytR/AlgR family response regulator transcription factor [Hufsiella ginkgonis]|uniref:Response regulator n=1 Tax=Hufsiella ginkgonis TaxID=2695274 RepID=A0A7K1XUE5_9SPHI|nr:LytTR family transcriptional regulator DNA-binding domain-containing protein [Hufsiella ginkgonis]MXV14635.1 response regulator [Hufsiella ginkgonis]